MSDPTPTPAPEALEPGGMVPTDYGMVPGCPNTPPCLHARIAHDVEDADDPLPMCCVDGCDYGHDRSRVPESNPTPDAAAPTVRSGAGNRDLPTLAPGTYELTKRGEVDQTGQFRWIDMPDGPEAKYVAGFWHKTRSRVRKVDGVRPGSSMVPVQLPSDWRDTVFQFVEQYEDARNIAEWLDACGAAEPDTAEEVST